MKFHDLVFGHELGSGAFSTVRYARHIHRDKSKAAWPEYAVKVVSAEKIRQEGYEANIEREIAILKLMDHPCVSRLISSFKYTESYYLVLEYASDGDLHDVVTRQGALPELATRFVACEVAAAILALHAKGFAYVDLKPENVLLTAGGHIKLADFGGARPLTEVAREALWSHRGHLGRMRDGGWRTSASSSSSSSSSSATTFTSTSASSSASSYTVEVEMSEEDYRFSTY